MRRTSPAVTTLHKTRFVYFYYLFTVATGMFVLFFHGRLAFTADVIATVFYIAMTAVFYDLSKPAKSSQG